MDSCFRLFRPHQHGIASKQAQVSKNGKNAILLGFGYKDELKYRYSTNVLVAIVIKLK